MAEYHWIEANDQHAAECQGNTGHPPGIQGFAQQEQSQHGRKRYVELAGDGDRGDVAASFQTGEDQAEVQNALHQGNAQYATHLARNSAQKRQQ